MYARNVDHRSAVFQKALEVGEAYQLRTKVHKIYTDTSITFNLIFVHWGGFEQAPHLIVTTRKSLVLMYMCMCVSLISLSTCRNCVQAVQQAHLQLRV